MPHPDPPLTLRLAHERYEAALDRDDRQELLTARLALCLALLETGWEAPETVREQMRRDEKTLRRLREDGTLDLVAALRLPGQLRRELVA